MPLTKDQAHTRHQRKEVRRREKLERLWSEGKTIKQIAKAMGWKTKTPNATIHVYRARGHNLPRRYSDERTNAASSAIPDRPQKATDEQILAAYRETGSVHKAGERLGMHGSTVHERLQRAGVLTG